MREIRTTAFASGVYHPPCAILYFAFMDCSPNWIEEFLSFTEIQRKAGHVADNHNYDMAKF